ncbi:MAG: DUF3822 family protein [Paludibacteraceae bacterium]|nr:DUF3822 family protein [Paludibacteraceae bacterium]
MELNSIILKDCILSIRLASDGFSFSVFNTETQRIELFRNHTIKNNYLEEFDKAYYNDTIFQYEYKQKNVVVECEIFTTTPFHFFSDQQIFSLFNDNWKENQRTYQYNTKDISIYFQINQLFENIIIRKATEYKIIPHIATLISNDIKKDESDFAILNIRENKIDFSVIKDQKFLLINTYETCNENEILFWVMNGYHTLNLDQNDFPIFVLGNHNKKIINLLEKYIQKVNIYNPAEHIDFEDKKSLIDYSQYASFLTVPICAL